MILAFEGLRGSGKTISATRLCEKYYNEGYTIYTNTPFSFKHKEITIQTILDFFEDGTKFEKTIFFIDEAQMFLDSRRSGKKINLLITYFVLQTRKRGIKLIYTTQELHQVDKRLRDVTEVFVYCESKPLKKDKEKIFIHNYITQKGKTKHIYFFANPYFDKYDTTKIIK